jgi:hypothetical protein
MTMPGFTADASLNGISRFDRRRRRPRADGDRRRQNYVAPAAAIYEGGRFVCYGEVTEEGFIDCYPPHRTGEPTCQRRCGPCQRMPELGPGTWRACLTRDCDVDFERCLVR